MIAQKNLEWYLHLLEEHAHRNRGKIIGTVLGAGGGYGIGAVVQAALSLGDIALPGVGTAVGVFVGAVWGASSDYQRLKEENERNEARLRSIERRMESLEDGLQGT